MQQINLYQAAFQKKGVMVSAQQVLFAGAGLLVLLIGVTMFYYIQIMQLESEVEVAKSEQLDKTSQLETLQKQVQARSKSKKVLNNIETLTIEIANKQKVLQILSNQKFGNTKGFTEHVKGLARQRVDGMWLTGISISRGGEHLALTGLTQQAKLLPQYLQKLSSEEAFLGKEFETLSILRNQNNTKWLDFNLRSVGLQKSTASMTTVASGKVNGNR